jgi:hypothetical protein
LHIIGNVIHPLAFQEILYEAVGAIVSHGDLIGSWFRVSVIRIELPLPQFLRCFAPVVHRRAVLDPGHPIARLDARLLGRCCASFAAP